MASQEKSGKNSVLSEEEPEAFLWRLMVGDEGRFDAREPKRLKGSLPPGVIVGHKTGTSGKNDKGVSAAVNDIGILVLPNGRHIAIAVLITAAAAPDEASERVIAELARLVADRASAGGAMR